jgi:hypothetical protein
MPKNRFQPLAVPPGALEKGGNEILRAAIVEGGLQVSMWPAFNEREAWGILLADITRHVARMYGTENGASEDETIDLIRSMFDAELDKPTDLGTTTAIS